MEFKHGDRVLVRHRNPWAALVRWRGKIKNNHVGVAVEIDGKLMLTEAVFGGVKTRPLFEQIKGKNITVKRSPDFILPDILEKVREHTDKTRYDFLGLMIHQLVYNATNNRNYIGRMGQHEDESFYCYEWSAFLTQKENYHLVIPSVHEKEGQTMFKGVWKEAA